MNGILVDEKNGCIPAILTRTHDDDRSTTGYVLEVGERQGKKEPGDRAAREYWTQLAAIRS